MWGGCYTSNGNSYADIIFPTSFPNSCWGILANRKANGNYYTANSYCYQENSLSKTGVRLHSNISTSYQYLVFGN